MITRKLVLQSRRTLPLYILEALQEIQLFLKSAQVLVSIYITLSLWFHHLQVLHCFIHLLEQISSFQLYAIPVEEVNNVAVFKCSWSLALRDVFLVKYSSEHVQVAIDCHLSQISSLCCFSFLYSSKLGRSNKLRPEVLPIITSNIRWHTA